MAKLQYFTGAVFMLKLSLLYPIDTKSKLGKSLYFIWGFFYVASFVTTFIQCAVYLYKTPFDLIGESMVVMNAVIYFSLFVNFTFLFVKRKKLLELMVNINGNFVDGSDNKIEDVTMEKASRLSDQIVYFWSLNCVVSCLMPTILSLLSGNMQLPILEWMPYNPEKPPLFAITYVWQVFCLINLGVIYAVLDLVFPCISILMGQQFKILSSNFKNNINRALLEEGILDNFEEINSEEFKEANLTYFKKNIRHHQTLLQYCEDINVILSTFLLGKISAAIFNTLFMAFSLITTGNHAMIFGLASYVMSTTIELFIYTYSGQILSQSADIRWPLYESRWYLCDLKYQRTFHIVQMRASKTVYTKAGNYFSMSASSFITFMKALCSYIALLKELTERGR